MADLFDFIETPASPKATAIPEDRIRAAGWIQVRNTPGRWCRSDGDGRIRSTAAVLELLDTEDRK